MHGLFSGLPTSFHKKSQTYSQKIQKRPDVVTKSQT